MKLMEGRRRGPEEAIKVQQVVEQMGIGDRGGAQGADSGLKIRSHWQNLKRVSQDQVST